MVLMVSGVGVAQAWSARNLVAVAGQDYYFSSYAAKLECRGGFTGFLKTYRTVVEISSAFRRNPDCKVHRLEGGVGVGIPDPAEARFGIHEDMLKDLSRGSESVIEEGFEALRREIRQASPFYGGMGSVVECLQKSAPAFRTASAPVAT